MYRTSKDTRKAEVMRIADSKCTQFLPCCCPVILVCIRNSLTIIHFIKIGSAKRGADLVIFSGYTFLVAKASNLPLFGVCYIAATQFGDGGCCVKCCQ